MKRKAHPARTLVVLVAWGIVAVVTSGIAALTTTEGVIADAYVVRLYRFLGDEPRTRIALSRLLNGLTVSSPFRPHLELLHAELRDGADFRWLFDKATRVLLRLGQTADARRFVNRWASFDHTAPAITRAIEIDVADQKVAAALARCRGLPDDLRADPLLGLTCADAAHAADDIDLARDLTRRVRDNAASSPRPLLAAHAAARDADDAIKEGRVGPARDAVARGLRAIGTFDPATLAIELRPLVIRLILTDVRLGHLDAPARAKRLLLAISVVEKTPELLGVTRELLAGALGRHANVYDTVAKSAAGLMGASSEFAEWWRRTGLSAESPDAAQLRDQRVETLARRPQPPRPFYLRLSLADAGDRIHNIGLFVPFGFFLFVAFRLSTRWTRVFCSATTLIVATAIATGLESVQYLWIPRRHADVNDVWTASVGALIGVVIVVAFSLLARIGRPRDKKRGSQ